MEPWLIVGAGRVGLQLARALHQHGGGLVGVVCRSQESRTRAERALPISAVLTADRQLPASRRVLLAVRDREIPEVAAFWRPALAPGTVVLHCSGALGPGVLAPLAEKGVNVGVFHPLLPFPHPLEPPVDFRGAAATLAGTPEAVAAGAELAQALEMLPVPVPELAWPSYHAAATLAGPLVYALLQAAQEQLQRAGFPPDRVPAAIASLAKAAVDHATRGCGWSLLTGPVVRGDWTTVAAHEAALEPELRAVYRALTEFIVTRLGETPNRRTRG